MGACVDILNLCHATSKQYLYGPGRPVLMRLARQAKSTDGQETLLITAELQEAAIVLLHALLHKLNSCLNTSDLLLPALRIQCCIV